MINQLMEKVMKYKLKDMMMAGAFALGAALFAGCDDEPDIKEYVYPEPVVTSYSPSAGYAKSRVTILGKGFGARYEENINNTNVPVQAASVSFGGVEADNILSVNDECIVVEVPENAPSGKIMLKVWTHEVEVGDFEVWESPTVSNPISAVVNPGESVTIEGSRFGSSQEEVQVRFGDTMGTISEWSESRIVAVAPDNYATGVLTLIVNGLEVSAGTVINPLAKGDVTIAYLKNYKMPFEALEGAPVVDNWTTPAGWDVNDAAKNKANGTDAVGGLHNYRGSLGYTLIMQAATGWDGASFKAITNGKVSQTVTLPAGDYRLTANFIQWIVQNGSMYWLAVKGSELPDVDNVADNENVLASFQPTGEANISNEDTNFSQPQSLEFTLEEETEVTIGFVATFKDGNNCFRVREIKLELL